MSWLDLLLKQTEENEAPERYFWWSGLAAISAIARKNVWINRHFYKLYPNIYVVLISTKSGARKGIPISICKKILEEVNLTRIISGCNSIQGMIQELSNQKTLDSGTVIGDAHGIMLSDEFDAFLTDDPKSLTYLTTLYNTHEHEKGWEKTLKNSPKAFLKAPCLTMLVASNEMLFDSVVKRKDIEGGFIGRTILVRESHSRPRNSLVYAPKNIIDFNKLAVRPAEVSRIKGEFKWTSEAGRLFDEWYLEMGDPDDRTGTYNRLGDQVLKVAMLISLSRKDDLDLEFQDVELAIKKCEECVGAAVRISPTTESSNGDRPNAMKMVLECICSGKNYQTTKALILGKLQPYQLYTTEIDKCINQLISSGWISRGVAVGAEGNINHRTIYTLTDEGKRMFFKEAKKVKR